MRASIALCAICLSLIAGPALAQRSESVPDSDAAIKIARAALTARFGKANTRMEEPLVARLKDGDTWLVQGTMPPGLLGGVADIEIARKDGRILKFSHGQ
jgi:hypothetical protein